KRKYRNGISKGFVLVLLFLSSFPLACQKPTPKRGITSGPLTPAMSARPGSFYALVIGIKNYQNFAALDTPLSDAKDIADILREQYAFRVTTLGDATHDQILD